MFDGSDELQLVELAHMGIDGNQYYFKPEDESGGTRRLLMILNPIFNALDHGTLVLIDELDAGLHTQVAEAIFAMFADPEWNPKGAQLVATTHDTNLLQTSALRRDQIWFTEKDAEGASQVYPLTDFRTRKRDDLENAYLEGRYGAVPPRNVLARLRGNGR